MCLDNEAYRMSITGRFRGNNNIYKAESLPIGTYSAHLPQPDSLFVLDKFVSNHTDDEFTPAPSHARGSCGECWI